MPCGPDESRGQGTSGCPRQTPAHHLGLHPRPQCWCRSRTQRPRRAPSVLLFPSFQERRGGAGPGPSRWVAVPPSALARGEALCSVVDPRHCALRLDCILAWEPEAGARCGRGNPLHVGGQGQLLPGTSWGCSPPGLQAHSVCLCFKNPSHCNDS